MLRQGPPIAPGYYFTCRFMVKRGFVYPCVPQRVILVCKAYYPALEGDPLTCQSVGITAPVPSFVVGNGYGASHF